MNAPPWPRFRIVHQSTPELREDTEPSDHLRIHGLPVTCWHHTHSFLDCGADTLIRDHVLYRLPPGRLGRWLGGRFVASDVQEIFAYREAKTVEWLPPCGGDGH